MSVIPTDIIKPWATKAQKREGKREKKVSLKNCTHKKRYYFPCGRGGEQGVRTLVVSMTTPFWGSALPNLQPSFFPDSFQHQQQWSWLWRLSRFPVEAISISGAFFKRAKDLLDVCVFFDARSGVVCRGITNNNYNACLAVYCRLLIIPLVDRASTFSKNSHITQTEARGLSKEYVQDVTTCSVQDIP